MTNRKILLCTVALCLTAYQSYAEETRSVPSYVPRSEVSDQNYTQHEAQQDRSDRKLYNQYEEREPCQKYRQLPRHYDDPCSVREPSVELAVTQGATVTERLLPIEKSYTVLFDFDKSVIRANEMATIEHVIREIKKYNPTQITVTGYTDSSGSIEYNQILSHQREQAVSTALLQHGVRNQMIDHDARGEFEQAIVTLDGVRNQQNRRVMIDFRR